MSTLWLCHARLEVGGRPVTFLWILTSLQLLVLLWMASLVRDQSEHMQEVYKRLQGLEDEWKKLTR
jgi:hypothetical protein